MKRSLVATLVLLGAILIPLAASAAEIRAYIAEFSVSPADSGDLKASLQRLFTSRLSGDGIVTVETPGQADVIVSGSYTAIGKMFSLDALAKNPAGKQLAASYEQGENLDALIPAVGKISAKLKGEIVKRFGQPTVTAPPAPAPAPEAKLPAPPAQPQGTSPWLSQRIAGMQSSLASWGGKELVIAGEDAIRLYRRDDKLASVSEAKIPDRMKILGVDTMGPDADGRVLLYVTIIDRESPASRIYQVENATLKLLAQDLPYLFRAVAVYGGPKQLFAQQMGRTDDYYGDVYEASFADGAIKTSNPVKMPRYANIFNFNLFRDRAGKSYLTAFSESGYLIVYSDGGEELWRSGEKMGGSETYFQRRDGDERTTGTPFRTRFIDQRIAVTDKGEVIVPQNAGFFVIGNVRSYSSHSILALTWNGSELEERWRSKQNKNYLADFSFDPQTRELVQLEVTQKSGFGTKGGSMVRVIRTE